ncbi:MAG: PilZ domain-containing protein [Deltaproteobacteria bacterium]|nr:PilZ domain-containing protein [Deltaproteobacteria bacterium]
MTKTRTSTRYRRRFRVTIGASPVFTLDLGAGGFSAELMRVPAAGSSVSGAIQLNGSEVPYAGEVAWAKPGDSRLGLRGRIGVRFTHLAPEVRRLFDSPAFKQVT